MSDRVRILLVDDSPDNLVSLEAALEGLGQELVLAQSGTEALRHLLEDDFVPGLQHGRGGFLVQASGSGNPPLEG